MKCKIIIEVLILLDMKYDIIHYESVVKTYLKLYCILKTILHIAYNELSSCNMSI